MEDQYEEHDEFSLASIFDNHPRKTEIARAIGSLAEIQYIEDRGNHRPDFEEALATYLSVGVLCGADDNWKFEPKILKKSPNGDVEDAQLFKITGRESLEKITELMTLMHQPHPLDTKTIRKRKELIEKYKKIYVKPDSKMLWIDKKNKHLIQYNLVSRTMEVLQ